MVFFTDAVADYPKFIYCFSVRYVFIPILDDTRFQIVS
jgi:hypothetical protein